MTSPLEPTTTSLQGHLEMALLFPGSKSEGNYPVLRLDSGVIYRIHIRESATPVAEALSQWMNQNIEIEGVVDDIRGHLRVVLMPDFKVTVVHPATIPPEGAVDSPDEPKQ